ncbi:MAG: hypothetical protein ACOYN6_04980 [Ignavibacteria bacterium]
MSDIDSEIQSILDKSKKDVELVSSIFTFHSNISGHELIDKKNIEFLLVIQIIKFDAQNNRKLKRNKNLYEILPSLKFIKNVSVKNSRLNKIASGFSKLTNSFNEIGILPLSIIHNNEEFHKYYGADNYVNEVLNNSIPFKKLFIFLNKHKDVSKILESYINNVRKNFLSEMIQKEFTSLNSIFIYFDVKKNLKQNTEYFYTLLNKKYSRQTIQTTIRRDLKKIKSGKFDMPVL